MAEKKAILVLAEGLDLAAAGDLLKKAAILPNASIEGLAAAAEKLGAVKADAAGIAAALETPGDTVLVHSSLRSLGPPFFVQGTHPWNSRFPL